MTEHSRTKCGRDWVFCDKDCSSCNRSNYVATNKTKITIKDSEAEPVRRENV